MVTKPSVHVVRKLYNKNLTTSLKTLPLSLV